MTAARAQPVIALDGPAGAGKSTAARNLAARLGFVLVDTGALYRGVALAARQRGLDWQDAAALGELAATLDLRFAPGEGGRPRLLIDGVDRSEDIRAPEISAGASDVSAHKPVREALLHRQRELGADGGVVLEGRDIGTVVFPDAEVKVFVTASPQVRAERRLRELRQRGFEAGYDETLADIRARDAQDTERPVAPLRPAQEAVVLDTTELDEAEVVDRLVEIVRSRGFDGGAPVSK